MPNYEGRSSLLRELEEAKALAARAETIRIATLARKAPATAPLEKAASTPAPPPNQEKDTAMEIDEEGSECSEATPLRPSTPEIQVLSKEDQIKLRVKEHIALWKRSQVAARGGPTAELRVLLTAAQESQRALQKLMDNKEIEDFVKGWNPWEEKKIHFPAPPKKDLLKFKKKNSGKMLSSSSANFSDPARWKKTTELLQIAAGLYNNIH